MSNAQFWAQFGASTVNNLFEKAIELRKNNSVNEIQALKDTIADMKQQISILSNEKVMLIRELARMELLNEQLTAQLKAPELSPREVL